MTVGPRLWIVTRKHPPAIGGMEELSYQTARQLARRRPVTLLSWGHSQRWLPVFAGYAGLRLLAGLVRRRVSVLLLGDPVLALLGWIATQFGVPVLCIVHGLDVAWPRFTYQAYLAAFFWRQTNAFICISRHTAELVQTRGVLPERIFVVPVGVISRERLTPTPLRGDPVLLFVGRLVPRKGAAWFVREVLPGLVNAFPELQLLIVGRGPERATIETAAREYGVIDHVTFTGTVDEDAKWSLLARCDALVVPNVPVHGDIEGFGIVALEAGAAGKPVFASDLEGLRDAVAEGMNGWRLPPQDAAAWIHALASRLRDRRQLEAQGVIAREHVSRNFNWDSIGESYAAIVNRFDPRH